MTLISTIGLLMIALSCFAMSLALINPSLFTAAGDWLDTPVGWLLSKINFFHKTPQPDNAPQADEDQANRHIPITEGYQELVGDNWVIRRSERQHHAHHHTISNNTLHTITRSARFIDNRKLYFIDQDGAVHDAVKTNPRRPK